MQLWVDLQGLDASGQSEAGFEENAQLHDTVEERYPLACPEQVATATYQEKRNWNVIR